jgi:hypothetical protein
MTNPDQLATDLAVEISRDAVSDLEDLKNQVDAIG